GPTIPDHSPIVARICQRASTSGTDTLSLHDALPICLGGNVFGWTADEPQSHAVLDAYTAAGGNFIDTANSYLVEHGRSEAIIGRSEEHTSELQSPYDLVCRLLLEKKKKARSRHVNMR